MDVDTLELLSRAFPGRLRVSVSDAAGVLGYRPQTARNRLCAGRFPVPSHKDGRRRYVLVADLVAYLGALRATDEALPKPVPRRRGRPTKQQQATRPPAQ